MAGPFPFADWDWKRRHPQRGGNDGLTCHLSSDVFPVQDGRHSKATFQNACGRAGRARMRGSVLIDSALVEDNSLLGSPENLAQIPLLVDGKEFSRVVAKEISQGVGVQQRSAGSHHDEDAGAAWRARHHSSRLLWVSQYYSMNR